MASSAHNTCTGLIVSKAISLLYTPKLIMELGGLITTSTLALTEAEVLLATRQFQALVLCHTLSEEEQQDLEDIARRMLPSICILRLKRGAFAPEEIYSFARSSIATFDHRTEGATL